MECANLNPTFWEHKMGAGAISLPIGLSHPTIWNCIAALQKDAPSSSCTNWVKKASTSSSLYVQLLVQGCETYACDIAVEKYLV